jgi:hypothetical protein
VGKSVYINTSKGDIVHNYIFIILTAITLAGCNTNKKEEEVVGDTTTTVTKSGIAEFDFSGVIFYDINSKIWESLPSTMFKNGSLGNIPAYTHTLNYSLETAVESVQNSWAQFNDTSLFLEDEFNPIPHIRIKAYANNKYSYNYVRYNENNGIYKDTTNYITVNSDATSFTFGKQDKSFNITDGNIYIPLVNEAFNGTLADSAVISQNSENFTHKVSIVSQKDGANNSSINRFSFSLDLKIPIKSFVSSIHEEADSFSLKNRWKKYFEGGVDDIPNRDFDFAVLTDGQDVADSLPNDIRIVFKAPPVLKIKQELFVEETIDLFVLKTLGTVIPQRGVSFREHTINLNSDDHFRSKFKINGSDVSLTNGREVIKRDIPAETKWNFTFAYDFLKQSSFPIGQSMLVPLKPECNLASNTGFSPNTEQDSRDGNIIAGGFTSICHPDSAKKETVTPELLSSSSLAQTDTWYDYFSYRDSFQFESTTSRKRYYGGLFTGIKSIEFSVTGCMRVYSRESSASAINPNPWEIKTENHPECDDGSDTGWVYFTISKSDDIFNHASDHTSSSSLSTLIEQLSSVSPGTFPRFIFNGSEQSNKLY